MQVYRIHELTMLQASTKPIEATTDVYQILPIVFNIRYDVISLG